jgi:hypothetical protein
VLGGIVAGTANLTTGVPDPPDVCSECYDWINDLGRQSLHANGLSTIGTAPVGKVREIGRDHPVIVRCGL